MDRDAFLFERWTSVGGGAAMFVEQVLNTMNAESATSSVGEQDIALAALRLTQPGFEYGAGRFGQRRTPLASSLADHPQVGANPKDKVLSFEPCHLREPKSGLCSGQDECVITPAGPAVLIRCGK